MQRIIERYQRGITTITGLGLETFNLSKEEFDQIDFNLIPDKIKKRLKEFSVYYRPNMIVINTGKLDHDRIQANIRTFKERKSMKIFITGGAGYIGSKLVSHLIHKKEVSKVTVYDNLLYKQTSLLNYFGSSKFNFIHADVRNTTKLIEVAKEHDVIIPLAAIVGMPACDNDPHLAYAVNKNHVKVLSELGKRIVYPNTNSGYGTTSGNEFLTEESPLKPISVYGTSKCAAETTVINAGGTSLRLATVFGISPRMRLDLLVNDFTYRACRDGFIVLFEKHFKRNYIHVNDVCNAFWTVLNDDSTKGQAYNVGLSNANISKMELCEKIKEQLPNFVVMESEFSKDPDKRNYVISNDKIERIWKPEYSLSDGIREIIAAYPMLRKQESQHFTNL